MSYFFSRINNLKLIKYTYILYVSDWMSIIIILYLLICVERSSLYSFANNIFLNCHVN